MFIAKTWRELKPHTTTAMGSGEYASGLLGEACFIGNVRILDYSLQVKYPEWVHSMAEEPDCYSSLNYQKSLAYEPMFYFGGPGRGLYCLWESKKIYIYWYQHFLAIKPPYCPWEQEDICWCQHFLAIKPPYSPFIVHESKAMYGFFFFLDRNSTLTSLI